MQNEKNVQCVGFIGYGEAASGITDGLQSEGIKTVWAYDIKQDLDIGDKVRQRAAELNVNLVSLPELAQQCSVIFSAVVCANALEAAESVASLLGPDHLYVDINATSPGTKRSVAETLAPSGCQFVDSAVMNPVPGNKHKVPMMLSGSGAEYFAAMMTPYNMNLTVVGTEAGYASSVKMLRSIFMKGMAALLMEMLTAAYKENAHELVLTTIRETLTKMSPDALIHRLVAGTAIHAKRRVHEMEEVAATLNEIGVAPHMAIATKEVLQWVDGLQLKDDFGDTMPDDFLTVLARMIEKNEQI